MKSRTDHFHLGGTAQDRIKLPNVFWAGLKSIGITPAILIRRCNLPPTVHREESVVTTTQFFAIFRAIRELADDPSMGWKFMSQVETDQFHPTLLAALHARTYRDSIERLARYKRLCGAQEYSITSKNDETVIEVSFPFSDGEPVPEFLIDAGFAVIMELGRRGTKTELSAKRIELARPAERGNGLGGYFGCPVKYRAARDSIVLRSADMELPFLTHNDELLQMLASQFETQLESGRDKPTTLGQVKWVLKRLLSGSQPDLPMIARELGMGERTLQRRIADEGSSFRQLLNETRHELAREYLGDESIEIIEAAFLVGYEDPNSFYRAFRSWEGTTPGEWRAARRLDPAKAS
ncbi:AraC family transcriptional regulator ligand-binding domain-containing protein [Luteolibacter yonseiensis]|uniref:AraC family transcriptional regulator ligand-binding domain-containing protein n=1 Tax=Luteolibacter yonseiensis TaxID=1144680 RepID=A0A934V8W0_9BACT|nr:AraC family transcriptional regulator [Luteolibacter yonseiensis]MBK1817672.1 AraC family transcriptional regulator ligand-binding domain-containing protein [Luteolibacter yonseiensis]